MARSQSAAPLIAKFTHFPTTQGGRNPSKLLGRAVCNPWLRAGHETTGWLFTTLWPPQLYFFSSSNFLINNFSPLKPCTALSPFLTAAKLFIPFPHVDFHLLSSWTMVRTEQYREMLTVTPCPDQREIYLWHLLAINLCMPEFTIRSPPVTGLSPGSQLPSASPRAGRGQILLLL